MCAFSSCNAVVFGVSLPVLNVLDHGTSFQVCEVVSLDGKKTAALVWAAFENASAEGGLTLDQLLTVATEDMEQLASIEIKSIVDNEGIELDTNGDGKIDFEGR